MPALTQSEPDSGLDTVELALLRVEVAELRTRQSIGHDAYLKLRGELVAERNRNAADRRRMDLLVALCQSAPSIKHGVHINTGEELHINPPNLRALLDAMLVTPESAQPTQP